MTIPLNPYVAGNPVGDSPAFIGRDGTLREVLRILRRPQDNALVLYGQRRIGKTSILQYLASNLPAEGSYCPVYFDLQDKAAWPLGRVVQHLASTIAYELGQDGPELGADPAATFRDDWLVAVMAELPQGCTIVLLLDEFDVLVDPGAEQAAATFFPYLRNLLASDPTRMQFVFVIGRNVDDLDNIALSLFKGTPARRVSLLRHDDTIDLARLSEANGTLYWTDDAVAQIWDLTHGHPFLSQQLCSHVWEQAYDQDPTEAPTIASEDVDRAVPDALDASRNTLEWLWDGLPPAERVVASALAEAGPVSISSAELENLLREHGVRVVIRELQNAPQLLQDWDLIEPADGAYGFRVELLRRWIAEQKPLHRVQEELDRIEPVAENLYQAATGLYRGSQLDQAVGLLLQATALNPNHVRANQLLADIMLAQGRPDEALLVLERLFDYQPAAAHPRLVQALLALAKAEESARERLTLYERVLEYDADQADARAGAQQALLDLAQDAESDLERLAHFEQALRYNDQSSTAIGGLVQTLLALAQASDSPDEQLALYERVLEHDPDQLDAKAGVQLVWQRRGDSALEAGNLQAALEAYQVGGLSKQASEIEEQMRSHTLQLRLAEVQELEQAESYTAALRLIQDLAVDYPEAGDWAPEVRRIEDKTQLPDLYQRALAALRHGDRQTAQTLLVQVIQIDPSYAEATRHLHLAVKGIEVEQERRASLLVKAGRLEGQRYYLSTSATIGRASENDLVLWHPEVSRVHAEVHRQGDHYLITDRGSSNGTYVNDMRLTAPQVLCNGDVIQIGTASLLFESGQEELR